MKKDDEQKLNTRFQQLEVMRMQMNRTKVRLRE